LPSTGRDNSKFFVAIVGATCAAAEPIQPGKATSASDLQSLILEKWTMIQWLEASFRCMEREKRGSDC
jgi:hypothetical protein